MIFTTITLLLMRGVFLLYLGNVASKVFEAYASILSSIAPTPNPYAVYAWDFGLRPAMVQVGLLSPLTWYQQLMLVYHHEGVFSMLLWHVFPFVAQWTAVATLIVYAFSRAWRLAHQPLDFYAARQVPAYLYLVYELRMLIYFLLQPFTGSAFFVVKARQTRSAYQAYINQVPLEQMEYVDEVVTEFTRRLRDHREANGNPISPQLQARAHEAAYATTLISTGAGLPLDAAQRGAAMYSSFANRFPPREGASESERTRHSIVARMFSTVITDLGGRADPPQIGGGAA